jgi:hypothetical protein
MGFYNISVTIIYLSSFIMGALSQINVTVTDMLFHRIAYKNEIAITQVR